VRIKASGWHGGISERQGDWVRRVRFWGGITRGVSVPVRQRFGARAFRPKARSPHPVALAGLT